MDIELPKNETEAWIITDIPDSIKEEIKNKPKPFLKDLWFGMSHPDVKRLQEWLNNNGYTIATSGAGSKGNETDYFGTLTLEAVKKLQRLNKINPPMGYFGPLTRAFINKQ